MEDEALCVLEMIQKTSWCCYEKVDSFLKLMSLLASLCTSNDDSVRLSMVLKTVLGPLVVMHSELSCRCDDEDTSALLRCEMRAAEQLDSWYHVRQCLTTACLGGTENIATIKDVRDGTSLNLGSLGKAQSSDGLLRLL